MVSSIIQHSINKIVTYKFQVVATLLYSTKNLPKLFKKYCEFNLMRLLTSEKLTLNWFEINFITKYKIFYDFYIS